MKEIERPDIAPTGLTKWKVETKRISLVVPKDFDNFMKYLAEKQNKTVADEYRELLQYGWNYLMDFKN